MFKTLKALVLKAMKALSMILKALMLNPMQAIMKHMKKLQPERGRGLERRTEIGNSTPFPRSMRTMCWNGFGRRSISGERATDNIGTQNVDNSFERSS